jgi:branched-chain amino acid transport system substrate-binding protein
MAKMAFRWTTIAMACLATAAATTASAQETIKIGFLAPLSGQFAQNGKQMVAGLKYFLQQNGTDVAGKRIELIIRDDGGVADQAKRIAQELIVNEKVAILAGFNVTPVALAVAPLSAQAKIAQIVTAAGASVIPERSPYIVRTFFTVAQAAAPMGTWAATSGINKVVTMVSDYAPGYDAEKAFSDAYKAKGGEILDALRIPLQNPDFAPFLQRARDAKPDALFLFVPGNFAGPFARQYVERGLGTSGMRLIGTGDITDDDVLNEMGDAMLGVITAHQYSAAHPSAKNKAFVDGIAKMNGGLRANFVAVASYDGMRLIYDALAKTGGNADGDALIAAMKGMAWESPRGPISIDPDTRDIVQNIYMREVKKVDGQLYNVEFATIEAVKDPVKAANTK